MRACSLHSCSARQHLQAQNVLICTSEAYQATNWAANPIQSPRYITEGRVLGFGTTYQALCHTLPCERCLAKGKAYLSTSVPVLEHRCQACLIGAWQRVRLTHTCTCVGSQVSGLSEDATEEGLRYLFSVHMPVLDVRLVRDKFSGAPRGFAFVELGSISDATRALNQLQVCTGVATWMPVCVCVCVCMRMDDYMDACVFVFVCARTHQGAYDSVFVCMLLCNASAQLRYTGGTDDDCSSNRASK